jgi:hypothetical protein
MRSFDTDAMAAVARQGGGNLEFNIEMVREFRANKGMVAAMVSTRFGASS